MLKCSYSSRIQIKKERNQNEEFDKKFFLKIISFIISKEREPVSLKSIKERLRTNYTYLLFLLDKNNSFLKVYTNEKDNKKSSSNVMIDINRDGKEYFAFNVINYLN